MHKKLTALALTAALPVLMGAGEPGTLTITVTGIRNTNGNLIACVFRDSKGFPTCQKARTAINQSTRITGSTMTIRFNNLAPGSYVASVQHDEDGNGQLKTNFIGMPKEGIGLSNNSGGFPRWAKSVFQFGGNGVISITMRYI
jgi:uncharacterized protein (DUF2141 family)